MRNDMHKTTRSRHKHGGGTGIRSSAIHTKGSIATIGKMRNWVMIDCYEHDHETQPLNMIECTICEHAAYCTVEYVESEALINGGFVSRPCHHCGITTMWKQFDLPAATSFGWSAAN